MVIVEEKCVLASKYYRGNVVRYGYLWRNGGNSIVVVWYYIGVNGSIPGHI